MGKASSFILGGLIGAAAALLMAPKSGAETRVLVNDKINEVVGGSVDIDGQVTNVINKVTNAVKGEVSEVAEPAVTSNDELREKIEAARARIAAQVAKNAEEAAAAAENAAEVVVEAVEDVTEAVEAAIEDATE